LISSRLIFWFSVESGTSQAFGGFGLAPAVALLQALHDHAPFEIVDDLEQRSVRRQRSAIAAMQPDAVGLQQRIGQHVERHFGDSEASTTARSTTFSSSRTLPGQLCSISTCMASGWKLQNRPAGGVQELLVVAAVLREEVIHQQGNVLAALAQRRQPMLITLSR
jgi:hypothetical protein